MGDSGLLLSTPSPSSTGPLSSGAPAGEQRQHSRQPVSGRVRLWLLEQLGFLEGALVDISERGMRIKLRGLVPAACLLSPGKHRIDVYADHGDTFTVETEIRHVTKDHVGLAAVDRVPIELFGR